MAILGPTASGKSELAMALASDGGEIISVDSMQVYRGMDIGTAKPSTADREAIRHHMIDVADPPVDYTVADFQHAARQALREASERTDRVVIVGGSGLHFRSLVDPFEFPPSDPAVRRRVDALADSEAVAELLAADPDVAEHIDLANPRRVQRAVEILRLEGRTPSDRASSATAQAVRGYQPIEPFVALGLDPGEVLASRIERRFEAMMEAGFLAEVAGLADRLGRNAGQAVGYKELLPVVSGECELEIGRSAALSATLSLAKRQRTYFRRDPRIRWLPWHDAPEERFEAAREALEGVAPWTS